MLKKLELILRGSGFLRFVFISLCFCVSVFARGNFAANVYSAKAMKEGNIHGFSLHINATTMFVKYDITTIKYENSFKDIDMAILGIPIEDGLYLGGGIGFQHYKSYALNKSQTDFAVAGSLDYIIYNDLENAVLGEIVYVMPPFNKSDKGILTYKITADIKISTTFSLMVGAGYNQDYLEKKNNAFIALGVGF